MNLRKPRRELSAAEIIDRSFSLYSGRPLEFFAPFLLAGILNAITRRLIESLLFPITLPTRLTERFFPWLMSNLWVLAGAAFALGIIFWVISTIINGMAVKYASDLLEKGDANLTTAFNSVISKLAVLLAAGLISGVLMILGLILFIAPGIIVAAIFSLVVPLIIIEGRGTFESFERSRRLVDKSWWKTFTVLLLVFFITILLSIIVEAVSPFFGPFRGIASALAVAFVQPIHPIALTYLYYSMRIKEEKPAQQVGYEPPVTIEPAIQLPAPSVRPRFCIYCGQELPHDAVFCPNCGKRIEERYQ